MIVLGVLGLIALKKRQSDEKNLKCVVEREEVREVILRAAKVYLFIMALVFLGEGFKPLILGYVVLIPPEAIYWVNMVSAVLDNATLAAAECAEDNVHPTGQPLCSLCACRPKPWRRLGLP